MKTICIAGTSSGVGKTSVAEMLLRSLKGWSAVKISVAHGRGETFPRNTSFEVVTRGNVLNQPGSDTARLRAAGAGRVIWVRTRRRAVNEAVRAFIRRVRPREHLIVEGNSFARAIQPNVTLMVAAAGDKKMKPSAAALLPRIDLVALRVAPGLSARQVQRASQWWRKHSSAERVYVLRTCPLRSGSLVREVLRRLEINKA